MNDAPVPHAMRPTEQFQALERAIGEVFLGQASVLHGVLVGLFAKGHVLLEGVPGVGKTLLVRALGQTLQADFRRVQFTPDLMPSDVTGSTILNPKTGAFEFQPGPIFTHILLADEINRAPAKTQSAMLEGMSERSVTVDGVSHPLPKPFFVLATQNPIESAGTYALPEAQLDRFLFKVLIEHPTIEVEKQLLQNVLAGFDGADLSTTPLQPIMRPSDVLAFQDAALAIKVDPAIVQYIAELLQGSRHHSAVDTGASPRAAIALLRTAQVEALSLGRGFVVPDDVKVHAQAVLAHRIILHPDAEIEGSTPRDVVDDIVKRTEVPKMGASEGPSNGLPTPPV